MTNFEKTTHVIECRDVQDILIQAGVHQVMDELIHSLTSTLQDFDAENIVIPARSGFHYTQPFTGLVEWMPMYSRGDQITIKLVGYHPSNPEIFDVPTILSSVYRFDTRTGHLMAVMDGVVSTALRTGAISAVATRLMAHRDSKVLGMIGCGAQAVTQIHALSRVMDFEKIMYYDVDEAASAALEVRLKPLGIKAELVQSDIPGVVAESDVLCTATSIEIGEGPLFQNLPHKDHLHINAVGSDFPGKVEIPLGFLRHAVVIPDFKEQAIVEGECQQLTSAEIGPEISALVKHPEKYTYIQERTSVFDSTGWALEDDVVMEIIVNYAREFGLGKHLGVEYFPQDTKNPYDFLVGYKNEKSSSKKSAIISK
jgi:ornithine cyclodeaminase/alanine dehydrogenase-like protein (mu-crystallin family)